VEALRLVLEYLVHETQVLELRQKIANQTQSELSKEQREYVLRRQLKSIQEELGEQSPEGAETKELRSRLEEADLPPDVRKEAERELARLERLPTAAPDYQLTRTYIELVLELPWRKMTEDSLDLGHARQILDEDHYDLKEVKERILEQLAVRKLNPEAKAPILCFVGPPGVGKTSLGQSIARSLGRKFERMSLGGLHDEAELRGHRRTYIGAMPGRILQAVRRAGVRNPVVMLDEVDKLGRDFRGDPASALLEILDPAQNFSFHDNYLNLPFDLSQVFFITTANTLDRIPQPLLDRMEVLRLAGYTHEEKAEIARRYLIPRQVKEVGLTLEQVHISDEALSTVISRYTREAGVRQLERVLGRIARKVAVRFAEGNTAPVKVVPSDLGEMLGPERFYAEQVRKESPPGVAAGLAWTEAGGDVLYVEAVLLPRGRGLTLTGQLGEVMQESARAAQSYLWSHAAEWGINEDAMRASGLHIHVPAGAIPKDGPSAGVTMAAAVASAYTKYPVRTDTAMTGEITLTGLVLPVGGIKEKVLAAHRSGMRRVILPAENRKDLIEIPEEVRGEIEFVFVDKIDDVLMEAITDLADRQDALISPAAIAS
jgi:ATP-dependent Lon protease